MIKEWVESYKPVTHEDAEQALREIMQEITLLGLQRSGFFEKAAFYGGTALRIFHDLPRFSEDLDFSLLEVNPDFSLEPHLEGIKNEFRSLGITVSIDEKIKTAKTNVDSAFLKPDTTWKELIIKEILPQESIKMRPMIKIKIEIDTKPPLGFATEEKLLVKPVSFYTKCFTLPDLFAGKMHALLFRKWKTRVKGRDWFDMEWYIRKGTQLNLSHFAKRAKDSGDWKTDFISKEEFMALLLKKIENASFKKIKDDVVPFIKDEKVMDIWAPEYFRSLTHMMKFITRIEVGTSTSNPWPLEYGKNIRITATQGGVTIKVFDGGNSNEKTISPINHRIEFYAHEIADLKNPMIEFKARSEKVYVLIEQY